MPSSTSSSDPTPGNAGTLTSVALAAVLVAVTAVGLHAHRRHDERVGLDRDVFWRAKIVDTGPYRCVLAGDSRVVRGLAPEDMAPALGLASGEIVNYGFGATGWGQSYLDRVDALLERDPPGVLVVAPTPSSFTPVSLERSAFLTREGRWGALRRSPFARMKARIDGALEAVTTSAWLRPVTEPEIRAAFTTEQTPRRVRQDFRPTGWVASRSDPRQPDFYFRRFERKFIDNQVSDEIVTDLVRFVERATADGVQVYGVRMPISDGLRAREAAHSGMDWPAFIERFERGGGVWLEPAGVYETYDGSHLEEEEARRFSGALGAEIARVRAAR